MIILIVLRKIKELVYLEIKWNCSKVCFLNLNIVFVLFGIISGGFFVVGIILVVMFR